MKAIVLSGFGDRTALQLADVPVPEPGPGEVLVRHEYIGVNFFDVYMREGLYARSPAYGVPLPFCLGIEGAGVVVSTGASVADLAVGDRVAYCEALGSYAEFAAVPDHRAIKLAPKIDTREAAAIMLQGLTAHFLTHSAFPLAPGHVCLVHAATGGVGQLLTRLARARGARVLATVGSDEKAAIARECGAEEVFPYRRVDFLDQVMDATDGAGVDVVFDSVGRDTIMRSLRSLKPRGTCVLFGHASGQPDPVSPKLLGELGSLYLTRAHLIHYMLTPDEYRQRVEALFGYLATGELNVTVDQVYPLTEAADAHQRLEERLTKGKILLRP